MKITEVQTIRIARMAHGVLGYLVMVKTDEGIVGLGEVAAASRWAASGVSTG